MNTWTGIGRLTRDPRSDQTNGGTAVCKMRVVVDRAGRNAGPGYFDVTCFDGQANACLEHLRKGREIAITGRLRFEEFETREGSYASRVYIVADRIQFLRGAARQEEGSPESSEEPAGVAGEAAGDS